MGRAELAALLIEASEAEREVLLRENSALADVALAHILKDICLDGWSDQTARALGAATTLKLLSSFKNDQEIAALSAWASGLEALVHGQMEQAIECLDDAESRFLILKNPHSAAATRVSKLVALAMLGRYDEGIACGLRAREVFLASGDLVAAGKIEHNLGNICFRRDRYPEAEKFQRSARERFTAAGDEVQITKIENSLALTLSQQHKIRDAEQLYEQALARAEKLGLLATQAEIESSIGMLALYQGRYDRALDYLERSRRKYVHLNMPYLSAMTEQEISDAYLELNLAPEAAEIYARVTQTFAELGLRAEEARARLNDGRAAMLLGQTEKAQRQLAGARGLYAAEGNHTGGSMVELYEAQLSYANRDYSRARAKAVRAGATLAAAGVTRRSLFADWLAGEATRAEGKTNEAEHLLQLTLGKAIGQEQPDIVARCQTSLGRLAETAGDRKTAEASFRKAIASIEALRAPLPAEEFRTAFFSDKLVPYEAMVRLCLSDRGDRAAEALGFVEQARGRALAEAVGGSLPASFGARDEFESDLLARLEDLRQELNYFYHQLNRGARDQNEFATLSQAVREREQKTLEIMRQLRHRGEQSLSQVEGLDIDALQRDLGTDGALIEYATIDDELLAFVVTDQTVEVVRNLGNEATAFAEVTQLRFQIDALRQGSERVRRHLTDLTERARRRLESLYDLLLRPIEERIGKRRLVIVPHRALHYLPFQALHDGATYLIERREVSYAPSAVVLQQCLIRKRRPLSRALLLGVADVSTPAVRDEIRALAPLFTETVALLDGDATIAALRREAPSMDLLHLACHGQFRPDNPLFSSLRLGDGWLTVRDAYDLNLQCSLVTLSACETGVNAVAPGDELIGLARGFFAAGSPSLVMSLWTVDDDATAQLMTAFYRNLLKTGSQVSALREAQIEVMKTKPHPFFWSPFVLVGRW